MATHGKKRHTKRLAAPKALQLLRKENRWVKTTIAGSHSKAFSIPLVVLLRDMLKVVSTTAEAKKVLNAGKVTIDGRIIANPGFSIGLMDVVTVQGGDSFVIINKKGKLLPVKTTANTYKLCKVTGKHVTKNGKVQLSLHDGRSLIVKDGKPYSTGDTLKLEIPSAKVLEHYKLEKGSTCYVFRGRHAGETGSLVEIHVFPGITPSNAKITTPSGKEAITLKDYIFVVDKHFKV